MPRTLNDVKQETKVKRGRPRLHNSQKAQEAARSTERIQFSLYPDEAAAVRELCGEYRVKQSDLLRLLLANANELLEQVVEPQDREEVQQAVAQLHVGHRQPT